MVHVPKASRASGVQVEGSDFKGSYSTYFSWLKFLTLPSRFQFIQSIKLRCLAFLKKMKCATVVPLPGVTQDIAGYKITHQPSIYVLETQGVLVPSIPDVETEQKLALAGSVKDSVIGEKQIARYLLAVLNTQGTPLHWKHLNNRRLEGVRYDSKEKHEYNLKEQMLEILIHGSLNFIHKNVVRVVYM
uniref:Uncharacterized protein n=1 Tax=Quercus lobata TaxID=97700 RepID=A0A7N2L1W0_QUELO